MEAATRDNERQLILDTLTRFLSSAGLRMATRYLKDEALSDAACRASIAISERIVDAEREAVASAIPKVLATTDDRELVARARVVLDRATAD